VLGLMEALGKMSYLPAKRLEQALLTQLLRLFVSACSG